MIPPTGCRTAGAATGGRELLEERGLAVLTDRWVMSDDGAPRSSMLVRIVEVTSERVRVVDDDTGAANVVGTDLEIYELPVPTDALQPA